MIDRSELAFLALCIPSRIAIALIAPQINPNFSVPVALIFGLGFLRLYLNPSLRLTGPETLGRPIWWNDARSFHAALWIGFAVATYMGYDWAWKLLALDVIVGLISFFFLKPRN
jgi:hypothetical protein